MLNEIINEAKGKMAKALEYLHEEFGKLQTGRANAALVEGVMVDSYGAKMPLKGMANITIPESDQIAIQPWNRDQLVNIEKAITDANLGFTPQNDGAMIRIILPNLTEERRKDLVKLVNKYAEDSRISIRNSRHEALSAMKELEKAKEVSEDELRGKEKELQVIVDDFNKEVETTSKHKETDIMTI